MTKPNYSTYKDALSNSMTFLSEKSDTIFIGQQILFQGNPMSTTLNGVSKSKMIEVPVMEESQMGMSLGMAMSGKRVITKDLINLWILATNTREIIWINLRNFAQISNLLNLLTHHK